MDIIIKMTGRPPKKSTSISVWKDKELPLTMKLRAGIHRVQKRMKFVRPFEGPVSIILYVSAPSTLDRKKYGYVGDLDSFVAGICDAVQSAHINVIKYDKKFEYPKEIGPDKPLLINDDSQIAEIVARKTESESPGYTLIVHPLENR